MLLSALGQFPSQLIKSGETGLRYVCRLLGPNRLANGKF